MSIIFMLLVALIFFLGSGAVPRRYFGFRVIGYLCYVIGVLISTMTLWDNKAYAATLDLTLILAASSLAGIGFRYAGRRLARD